MMKLNKCFMMLYTYIFAHSRGLDTDLTDIELLCEDISCIAVNLQLLFVLNNNYNFL